ncbi:aminoglycoside phosphotransferase family protein [Streptomyces sp. NBC_01235]|uniref:aminoglycoside phosphotransferase family protein n=1 Tax=Streptomyces sp. NBC_01235 TaxID=2903788 RepID=UPI002E0EC4B6|nr:aminoglycoside phosphotransferase family protein [Streptomyces sp. NBC_01235]
MIDVPETFVRATVDREGEAGADWIARLPSLLGELTDHWGCVPDGDVVHGGVGIVVPVVWGGATPAVLKVSFPHPGNVHEPDAFAAWGGQGAVRLYERDDSRFAMLLERVRASSLAEVEDTDEVAVVAGRISRRLAVPAPPGGLPRLRDMADGWERQLLCDQKEFDDALSARAVDAALGTVRELGHAQPDLLVHGDLHARNVLRAEREPWLAVDPKGWVGDPAYDGGTLLKALGLRMLDVGLDDEPERLRSAAHRILGLFSEAAGLDRERVGRWAQFHLVQAAFWGRRHGFRRARGGSALDRLNRFLDRAAEALTP